ncbi:DUF6731 family protein [Lacticaseibacillus porcinae]|uniref:DUF6731 family protein n=1 Tax=Lacticaseibacillus porcinae TaxID=1123687 RepID=UPI000F7925D0|nr:DUF6731 family protein [Lacticaseibacillus porcinae]
MASKTQKVKFEAYKSYHEVDGELHELNIQVLLDEIKLMSTSQRTVNYFGVPVRIDSIHDVTLDDQSIREHPNMRLTYFHVTKMRDEGAATTEMEDESLTDLELSPDEYIAEDISCVYDAELSVLFLQRNFHSLSITGICEMFKHLYSKVKLGNDDEASSDTTLDLQFRPVVDKRALSKAMSSTNFRSLSLKFANDSRNTLPRTIKNLLGGIGDAFSASSEAQFGLTITAGNRKNPSLPVMGTRQIIEEIGNNKSMFSSAIVRGKQGDIPVETFDLLNGKLCIFHTFSSVKDEDGNTRKIHLRPDSVEDTMVLLYLKVSADGAGPFRSRIADNL